MICISSLLLVIKHSFGNNVKEITARSYGWIYTNDIWYNSDFVFQACSERENNNHKTNWSIEFIKSP